MRAVEVITVSVISHYVSLNYTAMLFDSNGSEMISSVKLYKFVWILPS